MSLIISTLRDGPLGLLRVSGYRMASCKRVFVSIFGCGLILAAGHALAAEAMSGGSASSPQSEMFAEMEELLSEDDEGASQADTSASVEAVNEAVEEEAGEDSENLVPPEEPRKRAVRVYVNPSGGRFYHRAECDRRGASPVEMNPVTAGQAGFQPCPWCKP
ncbi:MAG: hypothetical protein JW937_09960 [Candidatus Omnitrophica bacterium]|nr:hypothetical protein [Candidatus Omnitrophota bacterium]